MLISVPQIGVSDVSAKMYLLVDLNANKIKVETRICDSKTKHLSKRQQNFLFSPS